jgi:hypothetical protein
MTEQETGGEPTPEERPSWLPDKFANTEQMADAYGELEQRMGSGEAPEAISSDPVDTAEAPAAPTVEVENLSIPKPEEALAGEDWIAEFSSEFETNGSLSDDSFASLEKRGLPRAFVERYIEGQQSLQQSLSGQVFAAVGGEAQYAELISWATSNLNEGEITSFNNMVSTNSVEQARLAVLGLQAKKHSATGTRPDLTHGGAAPQNQAIEPFESLQELIRAQQDPQYDESPKYRDMVMRRLDRSNL